MKSFFSRRGVNPVGKDEEEGLVVAEEGMETDTGRAPGAKKELPRDISAERVGSSRDMRPKAEDMAGSAGPLGLCEGLEEEPGLRSEEC